MKSFIIANISYFVLSMLVAVLWHLVLFHDTYVSMGAFTRAEPIMPLGITAILLQGLVFAYLYPIWYNHVGKGKPVLRGIQFSLMLGILVYTVMVFATAAKFLITPVWKFILLGTIFQILQFVVVGVGLGLSYKHLNE